MILPQITVRNSITGLYLIEIQNANKREIFNILNTFYYFN